MKTILTHVIQYFIAVDKRVFISVTLLAALLIWYNYDCGLEQYVLHAPLAEKAFIRFSTFFVAFTVPYLLYAFILQRSYINVRTFFAMLFFAPAIFTLKMVLPIKFQFLDNNTINAFWNQVLYWPLRLLVVVILIRSIEKLTGNASPGLKMPSRFSEIQPYLILLLFMLPLIIAASTQQDFLAAYPKLKMVQGMIDTSSPSWLYTILFELSYGSDFFTIEFFFRGFLIICFIQWAGKDAILPMACFYCTIHFGKPLGECISSYFGGLILGAIVYNTKSIYGGLIAHLGIAWLMEIGGAIGNYLFK